MLRFTFDRDPDDYSYGYETIVINTIRYEFLLSITSISRLKKKKEKNIETKNPRNNSIDSTSFGLMSQCQVITNSVIT